MLTNNNLNSKKRRTILNKAQLDNLVNSLSALCCFNSTSNIASLILSQVNRCLTDLRCIVTSRVNKIPKRIAYFHLKSLPHCSQILYEQREESVKIKKKTSTILNRHISKQIRIYLMEYITSTNKIGIIVVSGSGRDQTLIGC